MSDNEDEITEAQRLKRYVAKRGHLKGQLTRFTNIVNAHKTGAGVTELKHRIEKIGDVFNEFAQLQSEIELIDETEQQFAERIDFENKYFKITAKAKEIVSAYERQAAAAATSSTSQLIQQAVNLKLPSIAIPHFSGKYEKWVNFKDMYVALIHNNTNLDDIQKFYYLRTVIKDDALKVIDSLEISGANYQVAWDLLTERFENKRLMIKSHVKQIFDLPNVVKDSVNSLRNFLDTFQTQFRALNNLGQPVDEWSTILIYLLTSKCDFITKREWEIKSKNDDTPTIQEFIDFLTDRCKLLEATDSGNKGQIRSETNAQSKKLVHVVTSNDARCIFCKANNHAIYSCGEFLKLTIPARLEEVRKLKACTNCLNIGHYAFRCKGGPCKNCSKRHNTLLHLLQEPEQSEKMLKTTSSNTDNGNVTAVTQQTTNVLAQNNTSRNANVLLSTALIKIFNVRGEQIQCRALLDSGAQSNFITRALCEELKLPTSIAKTTVIGIDSRATHSLEHVQLKIGSYNTNFEQKIKCLVIDNITGLLPQNTFDEGALKIPEELKLADPDYNISARIDVLLGVEIFYDIIQTEKLTLGRNMPVVLKTKLGWVLGGPMKTSCKSDKTLCNYAQIENQLQSFWELEEYPSEAKFYTKEEARCEEHFIKNVRRDDQTGRFVVKLPFKENINKLGKSREAATKRFYALEKRLGKEPAIKDKYVQFMREYEELDHMEEIEIEESEVKGECYLPHHCVVKESSVTTKLRVVFDASMKTSNGMSLNDALMTGPVIQESLYAILIRFRSHSIVFTADIEKMYRCIKMNTEDREYQKIVWRDDPNQKLKHFRLSTLTYGTAPASFLSTRCLKQLADENAENHPEASYSISKEFYVDDWLSGSEDRETALKLIKDVKRILDGAGLHLRQWSSNDPKIIEEISEASDDNNGQYIVKDKQGSSVLGILWDSKGDSFQYNISTGERTYSTKRIILSIIGQIFDPLGLVGPVIVKAKLMLQALWRCKLGWDDTIPHDYLKNWVVLYEQFKCLRDLRIQRRILIDNHVRVEMHCFSDASEVAYGTCIYLKSTKENGEVLVQLVTSKSRVAPIKTTSLPRLELCGAVMAAKLSKVINDTLRIQIDKLIFWCDSQIVLAWLRCEPSRLKTFVANRVAKIQSLSEPEQWRHVPSQENPADLISRGMNPKDILSSTIWFNGPKFLGNEESFWPDEEKRDDTQIPECKENVAVLTSVAEADDLTSRFSALHKLVRITAYIRRFAKNARSYKSDRNFGELTINELDEATRAIVRMVQLQAFPEELKQLQKSKNVARSSRLIKLDPFLDEENIIRVGGRLSNANISFDNKHPIILPPNHNFTKLVIRSAHLKYLHAGPQIVLASIRQQYWVLQVRRTVRDVINKCVVCYRANPKRSCQKMGDLPASRVNPARPFATCGVDFAGPYLIKDSKVRNKKFIKAYVCIFICFVTKAVHIEVCSELSTNGFLNTLKRFVARRGLCHDIYSDNGTNFVGAERSLSEVVAQIKDVEVKHFLLENKITWHFIPPRSPHFGGLWESAVRLTKYHLKRTLNNIHLTYEDFCTILAQIESILNSRPLCPLTDNPDSLETLTPGHFLIGSSLTALPEAPATESRSSYVNQYKHMQLLIQRFWSSWKRDYLHELQQRSKWYFTQAKEPKIGQLVLLVEDNLPTLMWKLGIIKEIHPGDDGHVRVVSVKTRDGIFKRALTKICVLPEELDTASSVERGPFKGAVCAVSPTDNRVRARQPLSHVSVVPNKEKH